MTAALRTLLGALVAGVMSLALSLTAVAQNADDEYVGLLLETQRLTAEAIVEVSAEIDSLRGRIDSDDHLVFESGGGIVEVDLTRVGEMLPLALVALADPDLKAMLLDGLKAADPDAYDWALLIDSTPAFVGDGLENLEPGMIVDQLRARFRQSPQRKAALYDPYHRQLIKELEALGAIHRDVSDILVDLDAVPDPTLAATATATPIATVTPFATPDAAGPLTGCWMTPLGHARLQHERDSISGDHVIVSSHPTDTSRRWSLGRIEADLRNSGSRMEGYLYGTGMFDDMFACSEVRGGTEHWGTFVAERYSPERWIGTWTPCGDRATKLIDKYHEDWKASTSFDLYPVAADGCDHAFTQLAEQLAANSENG